MQRIRKVIYAYSGIKQNCVESWIELFRRPFRQVVRLSMVIPKTTTIVQYRGSKY